MRKRHRNLSCIICFLALIGGDYATEQCLQPITKANGQVAYKFNNKLNGNDPIVIDDSLWPTSSINGWIAKIILEQHLGYKVEFKISNGLDSWEPISQGKVHVNLEIWPSETEKFKRKQFIIDQHLVSDFGALGVVARNGWYVPTQFAEEYRDILSFLGLETNQQAIDRIKYTRQNYTIDPSLTRGLFIGPPLGWAPTKAEEQIVKNLNLPLTVSYSVGYGDYTIAVNDCLQKSKNHSGYCLFYSYFPSSTETKYNISRVGLPEYTPECYAKASEGGIDCDYEYFILYKIAWAGLLGWDPDVGKFFQSFSLNGGDQHSMLMWMNSDPAPTYAEIACRWIQENKNKWSPWIPEDFTDDPPESWIIPVVIAVSAFAGILILGSFTYWVISTWLAKRRFQRKARQAMYMMVDSCKSCLRTVEHPMILVHGPYFRTLGAITEHEELRDSGNLKCLDTLESVAEFRALGSVIIFFSHQWLGWGHPDPYGTQWDVMLSALDFVLEKIKGEGKNITDIWVWLDYMGIPQRNRSLQYLAIKTLPIYASSCDFFIVVAPQTMHRDTSEHLGLETYNKRMWCRAEQLSHLCSCGIEGLFFADEGGVFPGQEHFSSTEEWESYLLNTLQVFSGQASCCSLRHQIRGKPIGCDREQLVIPMASLYARLRAKHMLNSENQLLKDKLEADAGAFFPKSFSMVTDSGHQVKDLFGDLITYLQADVDEDPQSWQPITEFDRKSTEFDRKSTEFDRNSEFPDEPVPSRQELARVRVSI